MWCCCFWNALFKDCIGVPKVLEPLPGIVSGKWSRWSGRYCWWSKFAVCLSPWARRASSDSTTKNVCEHSAADQVEVLHVSVCCTAGWVWLNACLNRSVTIDRFWDQHVDGNCKKHCADFRPSPTFALGQYFSWTDPLGPTQHAPLHVSQVAGTWLACSCHGAVWRRNAGSELPCWKFGQDHLRE